MSDPERFDGDDGLALGELSELVGPDYRAELAELRAQVRYLADEIEEGWPEAKSGGLVPSDVIERLRALVGPWGYEKDEHEVKP